MKRAFWWRLGLVVLASLAAVPAHAQPSAADKETARALLIDGRQKMLAKDYPGALKAFQGAHAIMGVPTTGLDLARAQAALGQLVEARETALAVMRMPVQAGEAEAYGAARKDAEALAVSLAPRIPSLTLTVKGPDPAAVSVTLDGAKVLAATLGLPRKVNPGKHVLVVSAAGYLDETREVTLGEGASVPIELTLRSQGGAAVTGTASARPVVVSGVSASATSGAEGVPSGFVTAGPSGAVTGAPSGAGASPTPVWTWVAGGAGVVALGVGAAFFVDYLGVRDTVAADCPGNVCDPAKQDAASAQALRAQWNRDLGLTIGLGALAVAGVSVAIVGLTRGAGAGASAASASSRASTSAEVSDGKRGSEERPSLVVRARGAGVAVEGAF